MAAALAWAGAGVPCALATPSGPQEEPRWREIRSARARIGGDVPAADLRMLAAHVECVLDAAHRQFAAVPQRFPESPRVLACATDAAFAELVATRGGQRPSPDRIARFHDAEGAVIACSCEGRPWATTMRLVQRELALWFVSSRWSGRMPAWLAAGIGEMYCDGVVIDGRLVLGLASKGPVEIVRKALDAGTEVPCRRLMSLTDADWSANARGGGGVLQSAQALSMTRFLLQVEAARQPAPVERYLRTLHDGTPHPEALEQCFGAAATDGFEHAWRAWAIAAKASPEAEAVLRVEFLAEGIRTLAMDDALLFASDPAGGAPQTSPAGDAEGPPGAPVALEALREQVLAQLSARGWTLVVPACGGDRRIDASDPMFQLAAQRGHAAQETSPSARPTPDESSVEARSEQAVSIVLRPVERRTTAAGGSARKHRSLPIPATEGLGAREIVARWTTGDEDAPPRAQFVTTPADRSPPARPPAARTPRDRGSSPGAAEPAGDVVPADGRTTTRPGQP